MDKEKLYKHLKILIYAAYTILGWYVVMHGLPMIIGFTLPFIFAYFVALLTQPTEKFLEKTCHIPRKISAIIAWVIALLVFTCAISFVIYKVVIAAYQFSKSYQFYIDKITEVGQYWQGVYMSFKGGLPTEVEQLLDTSFNITKLTENLTGWIVNFAVGLGDGIKNWAIGLPNFLIFWIIFIISSYFMCKDFTFIKRSIGLQFPIKIRGKVVQIKNYAAQAIGKYLRGMGIMYIVVFCTILTGLLILRANNAFLLALVLAFADIFPILDSGYVLIPWGLYSIIFSHDIFLGIGLIGLYVANSIIRNLVEPKVMSKALGLHPLITLFSIFIGFKTFGFIGVIAFPILALVIVSLQHAGVFTIWKEE